MSRPLHFRRAALAALILGATGAHAQLQVNEDLGTLGSGTFTLANTTATDFNNAATYTNALPGFAWDGEYVYQFTLNAPATVRITGQTSAVNNDFVLLSTLTTLTGSDGRSIGQAIGSQVDTIGGFGIVGPGTYYLAADAYRGPVELPFVTGGAFSVDLRIHTFTTPSAAPSQIGGSTSVSLAAGAFPFYAFDYDGEAFQIDTEGSSLGEPGSAADNDTVLGLYNSAGLLVRFDDDSGEDLASLIDIEEGSLGPGRYYLAAGGFGTTFEDGFDITSTSNHTGRLVINGLSAAPVPEPASLAVLSLGALALLRRSRRG